MTSQVVNGEISIPVRSIHVKVRRLSEQVEARQTGLLDIICREQVAQRDDERLADVVRTIWRNSRGERASELAYITMLGRLVN